jgi:hypothetical protein
MDGTAYDGPIDGAREMLGYEIVIFSTRDTEQIEFWLMKYLFPPYRVTNIKEPAVAQIDDRAIRFESWSQAYEDVLRLYPLRPGD